ncbi:MAG: glycosyltransferase family 4 protein [Anaerolineales bacterium]|nr:glycosyltransferase family 4 protein [Anaerolineales bacterium]
MRVHHMNRVVASRARVLQFSARPTFGHRRGRDGYWLSSHVCRVADAYVEYQHFSPLILGMSYILYRLGLHSDLFLSQCVRWLAPSSLRAVVTQASIIQVEHPWLFELTQQAAGGKPIVYVAHNVEADLWEAAADKLRAPIAKLAHRPRRLEQEAVRSASAVVAMSQRDADVLIARYGADPAKMHVLPNGVDIETRHPAPPEARQAARQRLGIDERPMFLFMGSDHYPNKEALAHIQSWQAELGPKLGIQFVIVGGVGLGVASTDHMRVEGFVPEVTDYLMAADFALNPLTSGSGTSLKMVEYLACGLPTITTQVGSRGLDLKPRREVLQGEVDDFPELITQLVQDRALQSSLARNGRSAAEKQYSWDALGLRMLDVYEEVTQCAPV